MSFSRHGWRKKARVSVPRPSVTVTSVSLPRRFFMVRVVTAEIWASTVTCSPSRSEARSVSSPRCS